jgi:hypothetical protein
LCLIAGGSGGGIWYWKFRDGNKAEDKVVEAGKDKKLDDGKEKKPADDPKKRTLGKATEADLDAAIDVWDYSIRLPRGMTIVSKNVNGPGPGESYTYGWRFLDEKGVLVVTKLRHGADKDPLLLLSANRKFEIKTDGPLQFTTPHMPHAIDINGMNGARIWQLHQSPVGFGMNIEYRFHTEGWVYYFTALGQGKSEDAARRKADVLDVSICTFKKR